MKNKIVIAVFSPFILIGFIWHGIDIGFHAGRFLGDKYL